MTIVRNKHASPLNRSNTNPGSFASVTHPVSTIALPAQPSPELTKAVSEILDYDLMVVTGDVDLEEMTKAHQDDFSLACEELSEQFSTKLANTPGWEDDWEKFRSAIPEEMLVCTRAESAWTYGTMTADDFDYVVDDEMLVRLLHESLVEKMKPTPPSMSTLGKTLARFGHRDESYEIVDVTGAGAFAVFLHADQVASIEASPDSTAEQLQELAREAIDQTKALQESSAETGQMRGFASVLLDQNPGARYLETKLELTDRGQVQPVFTVLDHNGEPLPCPSYEVDELSATYAMDFFPLAPSPHSTLLRQVETSSPSGVDRFDLFEMSNLDPAEAAKGHKS